MSGGRSGFEEGCLRGVGGVGNWDRRGGRGGLTIEQRGEDGAAFGERALEEQMALREEAIEGDERDGSGEQHFGRDAFAAEAVGEGDEGERAGGGVVPAEDFTVENAGLVEGGEGVGEFGEGCGDVFAVAGVDGDAGGLGGVSGVDLGAHAVEFVFYM